MDSLSEIVTQGDRRRSLEALRDRIGAALDAAEPNEVAPLSRQLMMVLREIDELPDADRRDSVDDLAARRAARRADAARAREPAADEQRGPGGD
ncbi:hypothetical protein [Nocardiopsis synnemataformans]|uniref:hypothetical protein n=1 Tax=Nocardiopsis synnemataformans TaxID=61305 RepID=UPI003EBB8E99